MSKRRGSRSVRSDGPVSPDARAILDGIMAGLLSILPLVANGPTALILSGLSVLFLLDAAFAVAGR